MPRRSPAVLRHFAILRVRQRLLEESFPRAQMALLVALTGGLGLLASFSMLRLGLESMAWRYPLALAVAYLFFLFLIWLWLRTNADDYADLPDLANLSPPSPRGNVVPEFQSGGGGDFGGGGASATFDGPAPPLADASPPALDSIGDVVGPVAEADELAIPLVAIALAIGLAVASLYVVYIAPVLLAEVLVDGALSYALFRYLRGRDPQHWLPTAISRTVLPFAITAVFLALVGAGMSAYAPGTASIGEVVAHSSAKRLPQ